MPIPSGSAPPLARSLVGGIAGLAAFAALSALVHWRALAGVDQATTRAKQLVAGPFLDAIGAAAGVAVAAELSVVYGLVAAGLLWRRGRGRWSLAPLAFVLAVPIEFAMKLLIDQPPPGVEFYRSVHYPFLAVTTVGSYPSGHAMRTGFFLVFGWLAMGAGRGWPIAARVALLAIAVAFGLSRVYLGYHWLSDVVGGMVLGGSVALLARPATVAGSPPRWPPPGRPGLAAAPARRPR
ncbi:MAG: phosphatase PAP2 family protein [Chloroflexi bacterium]|nr:phosphatase PAP2 family protein [Chloroflexota bacterium]